MMAEQRLKTVTTINGRKVDRTRARISVFDNSLLYAEGLFETMLVIDGRVIFADRHLRRLAKGAEVIGLKLPVNRVTLLRWMQRTAKAHPAHTVKLRLTVTSGEAARWVGVPGKPQVILSASPHEMPLRPYQLQVSDLRVQSDSIFRQIKTISYAVHAAALKRARRVTCDDALLLNEHEKIAEVTSANIFWVRRGKLYTPPLSAGCLEGVTRAVLIAEAERAGLPVREKLETLQKLTTADEIFITSSLKLVIGVAEIRHQRKRYSFRVGPVTERLAARMRQLVHLP